MILDISIDEFIKNFETNIYTTIFWIIIIALLILFFSLIAAVLKIHRIEREIKEIILQNDNANDTVITQLAKMEKYLEILAEAEVNKIDKKGTPSS